SETSRHPRRIFWRPTVSACASTICWLPPTIFHRSSDLPYTHHAPVPAPVEKPRRPRRSRADCRDVSSPNSPLYATSMNEPRRDERPPGRYRSIHAARLCCEIAFAAADHDAVYGNGQLGSVPIWRWMTLSTPDAFQSRTMSSHG